MNYVYILKCKDNTLYTGYTNDLDKRVKAHNNGKGAKYTKCRRPCKLVYFEELESKGEALSREAQIKKYSRAEKLKLINTFKKDDCYRCNRDDSLDIYIIRENTTVKDDGRVVLDKYHTRKGTTIYFRTTTIIASASEFDKVYIRIGNKSELPYTFTR